jgi:hypothetical protein
MTKWTTKTTTEAKKTGRQPQKADDRNGNKNDATMESIILMR